MVNYEFISKNLCENSAKPQISCNGKCYLAKEISKTEKQNQQNTVKISSIDVFIPNDLFSLDHIKFDSSVAGILFSVHSNQFLSDYFSDIFHPPTI